MTSTSTPITPESGVTSNADDAALADRLARSRDAVVSELRKVIVGQDDVVEQTLIALLGGGHCLIVGVPGLAKTLLVSTIARVLNLKFNRIQFTPDLMPSDITGTDIIQEDEEGGRHLTFVAGPLFANVVLADEINRTPPKTQSALLEAMQERHVTVQGRTYELEEPFFVFATQNPIELEGTYPLPEAQLDRFMFQVVVDYLSAADEVAVVRGTTSGRKPELRRVLERDDLIEYQGL
ncbi:MAG TPA: AAA family ATPase, partial [Gemmatimonadales bacterium]|nr:AAA family ATPase [Gemmatimonadales bacterium]